MAQDGRLVPDDDMAGERLSDLVLVQTGVGVVIGDDDHAGVRHHSLDPVEADLLRGHVTLEVAVDLLGPETDPLLVVVAQVHQPAPVVTRPVVRDAVQAAGTVGAEGDQAVHPEVVVEPLAEGGLLRGDEARSPRRRGVHP